MKRIDLVLIRAYGRDDGFKPVAMGLLDIASYLNKHNIEIRLIDRFKERKSFSYTLKEIVRLDPRYIGISAMTCQAKDALNLGRYIKKRIKKPIIYGGLHFTASPDDGFKDGDIVVRGEGENALLEILIKDIKDRKIHSSFPISDLDDIPLPKESLIKSLNWNPDSFHIMTSRGCPFGCIFCLDKNNRRTSTKRHSVDYILDYIELVKRTLSIRRVYFADDIFTLDEKWVFEFCRGVEKKRLNIKLWCFSHSGINNIEMYKAMKKAGFYNIGIGVESGNNDVLQAIKKHQTKEDIEETINIIKKAGLGISSTFMIGNIKDTEASIKESIDFAKSLSLDECHVSFAQPFPGTRFYEVAEQYGTLINKDVKTYYNDKISFIPKDLSHFKLRKLRKMFIKTICSQKR